MLAVSIRIRVCQYPLCCGGLRMISSARSGKPYACRHHIYIRPQSGTKSIRVGSDRRG